MPNNILLYVSIYLVLINIVAIILTFADKKAAQSKSRRISEKTLFLVSAIGGSVGMLMVMKAIRHKTKHKRFMLGIPAMIILQIAVVGLAVILCDRTAEIDGERVGNLNFSIIVKNDCEYEWNKDGDKLTIRLNPEDLHTALDIISM
jgi:uncharacterized membrane protein YsdA (DUF1294 family)